MVNVVSIASDLGYLNIPEGMLIEPEEMNKMAADRVVVLSTGSQGEPMSALTRMARSTHRKVDILPGDTVIIAATPIPGNERYVGRTVDELIPSWRKCYLRPGSSIRRSRIRSRQPGRIEAHAEFDKTEIFHSNPR